MTPESARSMGFELTKSYVLEWLSFDESIPGLLQDIEDTVAGESEADAMPEALIPCALRGAAAFFSDVSRELEARAAALEATR